MYVVSITVQKCGLGNGLRWMIPWWMPAPDGLCGEATSFRPTVTNSPVTEPRSFVPLGTVLTGTRATSAASDPSDTVYRDPVLCQLTRRQGGIALGHLHSPLASPRPGSWVSKTLDPDAKRKIKPGGPFYPQSASCESRSLALDPAPPRTGTDQC